MKRYYAIIGIATLILFCLTAVSFAVDFGELIGNNEVNMKIPAGWRNGEKKGWDGAKFPPGFIKKLPNPPDSPFLPIQSPTSANPNEPVKGEGEGENTAAIGNEVKTRVLPMPIPPRISPFDKFLWANGINPKNARFGDWDGDGKVTPKDNAALNKLRVKVYQALQDGTLKPGDITKDRNGDGKTDKQDVDLMFKGFRDTIKKNMGQKVPPYIIIIVPAGPITRPEPTTPGKI